MAQNWSPSFTSTFLSFPIGFCLPSWSTSDSSKSVWIGTPWAIAASLMERPVWWWSVRVTDLSLTVMVNSWCSWCSAGRWSRCRSSVALLGAVVGIRLRRSADAYNRTRRHFCNYSAQVTRDFTSAIMGSAMGEKATDQAEDASAFDADAFYETLDGERRTRGLNWKEVAAEARVSPSTLTRLGQGRRPDVDSFARLVGWGGFAADQFV